MQTRSFTYVSDSADAISLLIRRGNSGEIYNVGNDNEITIINLARIILEITRSTSEIKFLPLPPFDPMRRSADMSKLRSLGFTHMVSLIKGIEMMIKENDSNGMLKTR
jgi:nucleoside-diphosphate-sugar epimerase